MTTKSFVEVQPGGAVHGIIRPPGSKSLTNRALICAALATGSTVLDGALRSDDTDVMIEGLRKLGMEVLVDTTGGRIEVNPCRANRNLVGVRNSERIEIFIGNSGTTIRFLTAALSVLGGSYRLVGVPRMHERPIADLTDALVSLGCDVATESSGGCPPVRIDSNGWQHNSVSVAGSVSSQYLSGLLMAAPAAGRTIELSIRGELVSRPYVDMTLTLMKEFGAAVTEIEDGVFEIDGSRRYVGRTYTIEPDASAASYHWAAAAITGGSVKVLGLTESALQGDVKFVRVLQQMGCEVLEEVDGITVSGRASRGIDVDMNSISDCVQTLAVVALFAEGPTTVRGVGHNRFKETDRIGDLATELRRLGAIVDEMDDGLRIDPADRLRGAVIETYEDHRMAMSFGLAGLRIPGVQITNPACTAKTYPEYFADLEQLIGRAHHWGSIQQ